MRLESGQLVIILSPYSDTDIYGNIRYINAEHITLTIKQNWLLKAGWDIVCLVVDGAEIFEFYSVIKYIDGKDAVIETPEHKNLTSVERRRFNRVDCEIGFIGRPVAINDIPINTLYQMSEDYLHRIPSKVFKAMTKNVGANGILAETELYLPVGMTFELKLKVEYFLDCTAIVRRVEQGSNNSYLLGCQFLNMDVETVKVISMFAFKEQLKRERKELNEQLLRKIRKV